MPRCVRRYAVLHSECRCHGIRPAECHAPLHPRFLPARDFAADAGGQRDSVRQFRTAAVLVRVHRNRADRRARLSYCQRRCRLLRKSRKRKRNAAVRCGSGALSGRGTASLLFAARSAAVLFRHESGCLSVSPAERPHPDCGGARSHPDRHRRRGERGAHTGHAAAYPVSRTGRKAEKRRSIPDAPAH